MIASVTEIVNSEQVHSKESGKKINGIAVVVGLGAIGLAIGVALRVIEAVVGTGTIAGVFSSLAATIGPIVASAVTTIGALIVANPIVFAAIIGGVIVVAGLALIFSCLIVDREEIKPVKKQLVDELVIKKQPLGHEPSGGVEKQPVDEPVIKKRVVKETKIHLNTPKLDKKKNAQEQLNEWMEQHPNSTKKEAKKELRLQKEKAKKQEVVNSPTKRGKTRGRRGRRGGHKV